ncbi:MAG: PH domain-containing protein [Candidatus Saccharibacteria bacterium]|jgi:membrane protein YdbS with pleckstrin-like domain
MSDTVIERYPGQDEDEVVQRVIHKHFLAVLPYLAVAVVVFLVGLICVYAGAAGAWTLPSQPIAGLETKALYVPLAPIGFLLVFIAAFIGLASLSVWRNNKLFITDENIVDMDQIGLFQRTIATLRLSRVQDISVKVKGPMQTIFHYGTVTVQTAGEKELFHFDYVPDPYEVKAYLVGIYEKFAETKPIEGDGLITTPVAEPDIDRDNTRRRGPGRPPFAR